MSIINTVVSLQGKFHFYLHDNFIFVSVTCRDNIQFISYVIMHLNEYI